ncbi:hypothetical protein ACHAW6_009636 [Cyclotella cf. meneghiniana]
MDESISKMDALAMIAAASCFKDKMVSSNQDLRDSVTEEQQKFQTILPNVMIYSQAGARPVPRLPSVCGPLGHRANLNEGACHTKPENNLRIPVASSVKPTSNFASKLHAILANRNWNKTVTWLTSGKAFCIMDREEFTQKILPKYFRESKFESFSRRIKRWGFRKVSTTGTQQVIYCHDLFQRDRPDLCVLMSGRAGQKIKNDRNDTTHDQDWFVKEIVMQATLAEEFHQAGGHAMLNQRIQKNEGQIVSYRSSHEVSAGPLQPQGAILKRYEHANPARPYILTGELHPMDAVNFLDQKNVAINSSYPMSSSFSMPSYGMFAWNNRRQVLMLEERIADCEQQLEILHRLKTLKQLRQSL